MAVVHGPTSNGGAIPRVDQSFLKPYAFSDFFLPLQAVYTLSAGFDQRFIFYTCVCF